MFTKRIHFLFSKQTTIELASDRHFRKLNQFLFSLHRLLSACMALWFQRFVSLFTTLVSAANHFGHMANTSSHRFPFTLKDWADHPPKGRGRFNACGQGTPCGWTPPSTIDFPFFRRGTKDKLNSVDG
ncbi:hypothetical protein CEXT_433611 [Caerostris extrusa]|uniref:Uncharacterized protein n=1 Tax=Caerostris extrusa TaxID=172846 RepID=A0AAV4TJP2_CAEEX|nr:hypothetical protein CEXT_433611 [Caerostris extrusa]